MHVSYNEWILIKQSYYQSVLEWIEMKSQNLNQKLLQHERIFDPFLIVKIVF